jgi:hypothetical protein
VDRSPDVVIQERKERGQYRPVTAEELTPIICRDHQVARQGLYATIPDHWMPAPLTWGKDWTKFNWKRLKRPFARIAKLVKCPALLGKLRLSVSLIVRPAPRSCRIADQTTDDLAANLDRLGDELLTARRTSAACRSCAGAPTPEALFFMQAASRRRSRLPEQSGRPRLALSRYCAAPTMFSSSRLARDWVTLPEEAKTSSSTF